MECRRDIVSTVGSHITLRQTESVDDVYRFLKKQSCADYAMWSAMPPTKESVAKWLNVDDEPSVGQNVVFEIIHDVEGMVGLIGYRYKPVFFMPKYNGEFWLHKFIDGAHKGQGIAQAALTKLLHWMKYNTHIERLYSGTYESNGANLHILRKFGFRQIDKKSGTVVLVKDIKRSSELQYEPRDRTAEEQRRDYRFELPTNDSDRSQSD